MFALIVPIGPGGPNQDLPGGVGGHPWLPGHGGVPHPGQGLPWFPGMPSQGLPGGPPATIWPPPPGADVPAPPVINPPPPHGPWPGLPVLGPIPPNQTLPIPPAAIWPPLPPDVHGKFLALVAIIGIGYRWIIIDSELKPTPK